MATLDQKINKFIDDYFPDIDYSILGSSNQAKPEHQMGLKYEYFVNAIEYYKFQRNIDSEEVKQISTQDMRGIDGCFYILNKQFFVIPDWNEGDSLFDDWLTEFENTIDKYSLIELDFYFLQSKSNKTELDKFKGFCDAVYDVFNEDQNDLSNNNKVKTIKHIFYKSCTKENRINLILKFCAIPKDARAINNLSQNGDWKSAVLKNKKELKSNKFESVEIEIKSGQDYQDKLETILSPNKRNYSIKDLNSKFIEIKGAVANCFIGHLNLLEIKEILENDDNELDDIFFDNIRYFEGLGKPGSVNNKIYKSLNENANIFHTLHNGITITAHSKHFNQANEEFEIQAFSIINGCQTCNLIWIWIDEQYKKISNEVLTKYSGDISESEVKLNEKNKEFTEHLMSIQIPVKIVITSDARIRAQITEAANSQNIVDSIQLIAISEEAKILQSKINDSEVRENDKLYYERLTNQFPNIGKANKISSEDIFRAFYSTFKSSPHKLSYGYGAFEREKLRSKDFLSTKNNGESKYDIDTYYVSSLLYNYLERYLRSQYIYLISLRHHILLLLCISIDRNFEQIDPQKKLPDHFLTNSKNLVSDKKTFNGRIDKICEIIKNFDTFIDNNNLEKKPKVKPKSYYSEEGTKSLTELFIKKYYPEKL